MGRYLLGLAVIALVAGCTPEPEGPRPGANPVPLDTALSVFDKSCGATRPNFDGAAERMQANGLTIASGGRLSSAQLALSGAVTQSRNGQALCSVRATHAGDLLDLQEKLAARFGKPNFRDSVMPGVLTYKRGSARMLLLIQSGSQGGSTTRYEIGYVQGL